MTILQHLFLVVATLMAAGMQADFAHGFSDRTADSLPTPDCEAVIEHGDAAAQHTKGAALASLARAWRHCYPEDHDNHSWSYPLEAQGWYKSGHHARATQMVDTLQAAMEAGTPIRLHHQSLTHEWAGIAYHHLQEPTRALYQFQIANLHASTRTANDRVNLLRSIAGQSFALGDEVHALETLESALVLADSVDASPFRRGRLHYAIASQQLDRSFRDHPIDTSRVRHHLDRAEALLSPLSDSISRASVRIIPGFRGDLLVLQGEFERAHRFIQETYNRASEDGDPRAVVVAHNMFAFLEMKRNHLGAALHHIQKARDLNRQVQRPGLTAVTLRIQIQIAVARNDRDLALETLQTLEGMSGTPFTVKDVRYASVLMNKHLDDSRSSWPWVVVALAVLGAAALVHMRRFYNPAGDSLPALTVSGTIAEECSDGYSGDGLHRSSKPSSGLSPSSLSPEESVSPDATQEASDCPHFPIYTDAGVPCGTMPVPRFLRTPDGRALVGVETDTAILVIEKPLSASSEIAQRTDGGGFSLTDLPFKIHGVVVAELAYRNRPERGQPLQ